MITLLCEDSISGVFSAIYEAWAGRYNREELHVRAGGIDNYEMFMEYRQVETAQEQAAKVARTLQKQFGEKAYEKICYALWSNGEDKADAVYGMVRFGIENHCGYAIHNYLTEEPVCRVFQLSRGSFAEAHHYLGFIRFAQLDNGILYAAIEPKNNVLEPVAVHFEDRLPGENWVIHDKTRGCVAVHQAGDMWLIADEQRVMEQIRRPYADGEEDFRQLWRNFCHSVSIEARENLKLQRQNLPLRFRRNMV